MVSAGSRFLNIESFGTTHDGELVRLRRHQDWRKTRLGSLSSFKRCANDATSFQHTLAPVDCLNIMSLNGNTWFLP